MEPINEKQKKHKHVSFKNDIIEPKPVIKCGTCGHRNVGPRIRETFLCQKCEKFNCLQCINDENSICCSCTMDEEYPPKELTEEVIQKINEDRAGTLFKRYCVNCGLRIAKGTYCHVCQNRKNINEDGGEIKTFEN